MLLNLSPAIPSAPPTPPAAPPATAIATATATAAALLLLLLLLLMLGGKELAHSVRSSQGLHAAVLGGCCSFCP